MADDALVADRTGGDVPGELVAALLARLAAESEPALPGRALALGDRRARIVLAVGGSLVLTLVLVGVPALLGYLL